MNNCRLVQFNGSVNDNNLPVYDSLGFDVEPGDFNMYICAPAGTVVTFDNGTDTIKVGADTITSGWVYPATQESRFNATITRKTHFEVKNLYSITTLNQLSTNTSKVYFRDLVSELKYGSLIRVILPVAGCDGEIDIADIKNPSSFTRFQYEVGNLTGNLTDFQAFTSADWLMIKGSDAVQGNINAFIPLKSLVNISVENCTNVMGTVESLVEGQCASPARTSGTLHVWLNNSKCTFNGNRIAFVKIEFNATGATVKNSSNVLIGTYSNGSWSYE